MNKILLSLLYFASLSVATSTEMYIRHNEAGYVPNRTKSLVLMAATDQKGNTWCITNSKTDTILTGNVDKSVIGTGNHTSHPFNHIVDFSSLKDTGLYLFNCNKKSAQIRIAKHPYSGVMTDLMRHLKTARSGTRETLNHKISHLGDSAAIVYTIDGTPDSGLWKQTEPLKTVDIVGGWYDAGDFIKFTLTIANTVYYLLDAWEINPKAFTTVLSASDLPDVLDEACFGLCYLLKTYPDENCFVIQVGNGLDHRQGRRLPENDELDGKRPALCAISPVHMGITAAALAKGARVFKAIGKNSFADTLKIMSQKIFERATHIDALTVAAYEKDATNDFYRDITLDDNMSLASIELFKTTGDSAFLLKAIKLAPPPAYWIGWGAYNFNVNFELAPYHSVSENNAKIDVNKFISQMDTVWGIPLDYCWGALSGWNGAGAAAGRWNRVYDDAKANDLHLKMVDLLFGRNNWGVSFLASTRLSNTIRYIYNPMYWLTDAFPMGAVALGPGDRKTHQQMEQHFGKPPASELDKFQTKAAIYHDWGDDFMLTETVTMSQSYALWMLALACDTSEQAPADTTIPTDPNLIIQIDSLCKYPLDQSAWYLYADSFSTAKWTDSIFHNAELTVNAGVQYPYAGFGFEFPESYRNSSAFDGMKLYGSFEEDANVRIELGMSIIDDYDCHGKFIIGKGESSYTIMFNQLSQQGFGKSVKFNSSDIAQVNITYTNTGKKNLARIDSVIFFRLVDHKSMSIRKKSIVKNENFALIRNGNLIQYKGETPLNVELRDLLGRRLWKHTLTKGTTCHLPYFAGMQLLIYGKEKRVERLFRVNP